jgi:hypothetical protein
MSVTLANAKLLGLDDKQSALAEEIITVDELFAVLPFKPVSGNSYSYVRENTLVTAEGQAVGGAFTPGQSTYTEVTVPLTTIGAQVEINKLLQAQSVGAVADGGLVASQLARAAKSVGRQFAQWFVTGDSTTSGQFDGVNLMLAAGGSYTAFSGQSLNQADAALTLEMLDDLVSAVKLRRPDVLVMSQKARNKVKSLMRALGGVTTIEVGGRHILAYDGIPMVANDWIVADVDGVTAGSQQHIYAMCLGDDGVVGLTTGSVAGINAEMVGTHQTKDQDIWRVKMYGGIAVHSTKSIARLESVTV